MGQMLGTKVKIDKKSTWGVVKYSVGVAIWRALAWQPVFDPWNPGKDRSKEPIP